MDDYYALVLYSLPIFLLPLGLFALWVYGAHGPVAKFMRRRAFTVFGAVFVLWSYLVLPWARFEILSRFDLDSFADALLLLEQAGAAGVIFKVAVESLSLLIMLLESPPGLLFLMLLFDPAVAWLVLVPLLVALVALPLLLFTLPRMGTGLRMTMCMVQSAIALLGLSILLWILPEVEAFGTAGLFPEGLLPVLANARLEWGVWVAVVGIFLVFLGGAQTYGGIIVENPDVAGPIAEKRAMAFDWLRLSRPQWITIVGTSVMVVSFVILPWVDLSPERFDSNFAWFQKPWDFVVQPVCRTLHLGSTEDECAMLDLSQVLFDTFQLSIVYDMARNLPYLSGLGLLLQFPNPGLFQEILLVVTIVAGVMLVWSIATLTTERETELVALISLGGTILASLALLWLIYSFATIDTFGTRDFLTGFLATLAEARVGYGAGLYLLGLALVVIGQGRAAGLWMWE